jgi:hypothetical protein
MCRAGGSARPQLGVLRASGCGFSPSPNGRVIRPYRLSEFCIYIDHVEDLLRHVEWVPPLCGRGWHGLWMRMSIETRSPRGRGCDSTCISDVRCPRGADINCLGYRLQYVLFGNAAWPSRTGKAIGQPLCKGSLWVLVCDTISSQEILKIQTMRLSDCSHTFIGGCDHTCGVLSL